MNPVSADMAAGCGNCGSNNRWLLHNVRLRDMYRRLCTSCVLRLHPSSFCPSCFTFYDSGPPHPSKRLSCSKCSSFTHSHCAPSSPTPYLCPPCKDSKFSFFDVNAPNNNNSNNPNCPVRFIDKKLADALLCAAKIASASMGKGVIIARAEAERRVREAAVARKRAKEALEKMSLIYSKEGWTKLSGSVHSEEAVVKKDNGMMKHKCENSCGSEYQNGDAAQGLQVALGIKQEDVNSK
ncbi:uncharacterized protein LOC110815436 [Carica papaya]|uniref:uncharacterized protein LOC110815436 n=1 Tax=Carica papaya TaxID=3649 RepID=UPI000B8C9520|nr:uncharacterized protein LOC110815436 [Carica papaya]